MPEDFNKKFNDYLRYLVIQDVNKKISEFISEELESAMDEDENAIAKMGGVKALEAVRSHFDSQISHLAEKIILNKD